MSTPTSAPPLSRGNRSTPTKRGERAALANVHAYLGDVEKWFIKRGLPHFIEDYKATDDVFNRALPLIVLLIVVQMGFELTSKTVTWQNRGVGAALGLGAVLVLFLIANLIRQPQSWYKWPRKVGVVEMTLLVVLGPAVGLMARASKKAVGADLAANVAVLLVVYALVAYAVLPVILWAIRHSVREVGNLINLASKALPMLALFGTFLFLNVDMWHIASFLTRRQLWTTVGFFSVITFLFLMVRLPEEVRSLSGDYSKDSVVNAATDTPLIRHVQELDDELHPISPNRKQRINMLFVLAFTQIIQVLLLSLVVFVYFVTLGKLAVTPNQVGDWLNIPESDPQFETLIKEPGKLFGADATIPLHLVGLNDISFSEPLLQTAILLTTFSAFFFAVSAVTDETYRKDFFESITGKLVKALELRCGYVNLYVKAAKTVGPGAGRARDGIGYDFHAEHEDHKRTLHVPILPPNASPSPVNQALVNQALVNQPLVNQPLVNRPPAFQVDSFQPPQPQQHYQQAPNPFQNQGVQPPAPGTPQQGYPQQPPVFPQPPAPHDEDPFMKWPQQQ